MALIYEVPTHLNVEDSLIFGLTARQLLRISVGWSLAYAVWDQTPWFLDGLRGGLAGAFVGLGLVLGLLQPAGRPLDQWLLAVVLFSVTPRHRVWRLLDRGPRNEHTSDAPDWAEQSPVPEWLGPADADSPANSAHHREGQWFARGWRT